MQTDIDKDLLAYFTDVQYLRNVFKESVAAPVLAKRILVIHGIGGVGKSSLLRMFRLHCKSVKVSVALASGDEAKSALDVLTRWTDDLKADGIAFRSFNKTLEHYHTTQAKVGGQAKKVQDEHSRAVDVAGKVVSKTAEAASGALAGAVIGSVIPGFGTVIGGALGGVLGGMGGEALVDWLRGFLPRQDIDLLLEPAQKLTYDFLADVTHAADKERIVLILDTFEQMTILDDWARDVAQRLPTNVLYVIAGRALPNWSRTWQGWMANAQVEELKPMTEEVMRDLVQRYYATMRGGKPDPAQVDAIIRFARGLPMVVASSVQLWVKYGVEDFQSVKAEVVANLVDRLMEGVPKALIPALEAAAVVRWFDQPILRAVMGIEDVREPYNELRRFPFVRTRVEGLALHDAVREIMDENLRTQDSERHCELHNRAAAHFERRMEKATDEEARRLGLERLYHRTRADEGAGIHLFQEMSERLVQYRLFNLLRELLNDVNTYPLEKENSKAWRKYYFALLLDQEEPPHLDEVEKIYEEIIRKNHEDSYLRAKTLLKWIGILQRDEYYIQPGRPARVESMLKECEKLLPENDWERHLLLINKSIVRKWVRFQDTYTALMEVINFCISRNDYYALVSTCQWVKGYAAMHGRWREFLEIEQKVASMPDVNANPMLRARTFSDWQIARIWMGRYAETERILKEVEEIQTIGDKKQGETNLDLLYAITAQRRIYEVIPLLERERDKYYALGQKAIYDLASVLRHLGIAHLYGNDTANAKKYLSEAVEIISELNDPLSGVHEDAYFLGFCCLARHEWKEAKECFSKYLAFPFDDWHFYFKSGALVGLIRINEALGREEEIPPLLLEAESLAQQYEYNDHLASLRLMQGHIAWKREALGTSKDFDGLTPFEIALHYYQQAFIFALRFNRFLLDDVLWGSNISTPLRPIISLCLERGEEGKRMLSTLRDWWKTGINEISTSHPDTISAIPAGIPLLEAEGLAREREPGDGSPQKSVVEQINSVLSS